MGVLESGIRGFHFLDVPSCLGKNPTYPLYNPVKKFGSRDPREDPKSRTPKSGLQYSPGVDYGALKRILLHEYLDLYSI